MFWNFITYFWKLLRESKCQDMSNLFKLHGLLQMMCLRAQNFPKLSWMGYWFGLLPLIYFCFLRHTLRGLSHQILELFYSICRNQWPWFYSILLHFWTFLRQNIFHLKEFLVLYIILLGPPYLIQGMHYNIWHNCF